MPATTSELKEKNNFRGNILDRNFPVHFNAKTGAYSYNYADVSPALASELEKMKYFRVSSPTLAEVEAELAKHLKKEGPAPPPVKGEITKAAEEQIAKALEIKNVGMALVSKRAKGTPLSAEEEIALTQAEKEKSILQRAKKAQEAKRKYNSLWDEASVNIKALETKEANLKKYNNTPANKRNASPPPGLTAEETAFKASPQYAELQRVSAIIDAYELLESLEEEVKKGTELTADQQLKKTEAETLLNATPLTNEGGVPKPFPKKIQNIEGKQKYNNARALITQIEGTPENKRSAKQLKNLANAKVIVRDYEAANPKAFEAAFEKEANIFMAEATRYQNKRNAAQKLISELNAKKNLSAEEQAKKTKSQNVVTAYTTYTNPFATGEEKAAAEKTLKNAPNSNTPSPKGLFGENNTIGGRRKTRRRKSSKRKTQKRKH